MHPDGIQVVYQPRSRPPRRVRFEPTSDGWVRETAQWSGCTWRVTGSEPVTELHVEMLPAQNHDAVRGP